MRSRIDDIDLIEGVATVREKKRDRSRELTFRRVPLTPVLKSVLTDWFNRHPGGQFTFCQTDTVPMSKAAMAKLFRRIVRDSEWAVRRRHLGGTR